MIDSISAWLDIGGEGGRIALALDPWTLVDVRWTSQEKAGIRAGNNSVAIAG